MNISFGQLVILILIGLLLFGDISSIINNINKTLNNIKNYKQKNNKKKKL